MFANRMLSQDEIGSLLEAARWAASSNNYQPWRFIYAQRDEPGYEKIVQCLSEFNQAWVIHAPMLMLTAYKEQFDNGKENFHALHDLGLAMGNLSIQAQHMRLAVHHMAGVDWRKAQQVFKVPEGYHISTAVAIGPYGGDEEQLSEDLRESERKKRSRKPVEAFAAKGSWPSLSE